MTGMKPENVPGECCRDGRSRMAGLGLIGLEQVAWQAHSLKMFGSEEQWSMAAAFRTTLQNGTDEEEKMSDGRLS